MKQYKFLTILMIGLAMLAALPAAAQDEVEANKAIVTRYIEEIFSSGNTDLMEELFTDDFTMHNAFGGKYGRAFFSAVINGINTPPMDMGMSNYFLIGQGDLAAEIYVYGGTLDNRPVATPAVDFIRFEGGKIAEIWAVWDYTFYALQPFSDDRTAVPDGWFPVPGSTSATPDENTALVERALDIWKTGNTDNIDDVYAGDVVFHLPLSISTQPLDRDGVAAYIAWLHTQMPDFTLDTEGFPSVAEGNLVAYYYTWGGKITHEVQGDTRSQPVRAEAADLYRIEDGKITEVWWNWYARGFYQFNWFAPPAAAQDEVEANKAVVTRYTEEIYNGGNTDLVSELFIDDFKLHDPVFGTIYGSQSVAEGIENVHDAPNRLLISDYILLGQGDLVAEVYTAAGTVSNKPVGVPEIDIIRLEDGKIVETWALWDSWLASAQRSLPDTAPGVPDGWFPAPGTSSATPEENTALVQRAVEMWRTGNTDNIADVYADDLVFHFPLSISTQTLDREGVSAYIAWLHMATPDFTIDAEGLPSVAEGNLVVYHYNWQGKFSPDASHQYDITATATDLYRLEDGKIAEVWWNWFTRSAMQLRWFAPPTEN
jgi:predicted SnoaL-like aldol condensation-catalyzing enzyme